jgi:hypothetical protein
VRIAIGQFMEESNTFVRQRADLDHFRATQLLRGNDIVQRLRGTRAEVGGFLDVRSRPLFPFEDDFEPEIPAVLGPDRCAGDGSDPPPWPLPPPDAPVS